MSDEREQLRQDIAGAIYDATGLRGAVWAEVSDVASEHALADHVMTVVAPLVAEHDEFADAITETAVLLSAAGYCGGLVESVKRLIKDTSDARDEAFAAREDLALGDGRLSERTAQCEQERESRLRWAEEAAEMEKQRDLLAWLHAEAVWDRDSTAELFNAAASSLAQHHTWRGVMSLLDEHYPASVFDGSSGDDGPRVVALVRSLAALRASSVVLPPDSEKLVTVAMMPWGMAATQRIRGLIESWLPATVEATPPTLAETRTEQREFHDAVLSARSEGVSPPSKTPPKTLGGINYGSHVGEVDAPPESPSPAVDPEPMLDVLITADDDWHTEHGGVGPLMAHRYMEYLAERLISAGWVRGLAEATPTDHQEPCGVDHQWEGIEEVTGWVRSPVEQPAVSDAVPTVSVQELALAIYQGGLANGCHQNTIARKLLARYDIRERGETA